MCGSGTLAGRRRAVDGSVPVTRARMLEEPFAFTFVLTGLAAGVADVIDGCSQKAGLPGEKGAEQA